jgi:hypothetical protein
LLLAFFSNTAVVVTEAATYALAMAFPFFGALLGFFGGFAFLPTTYFVSTH